MQIRSADLSDVVKLAQIQSACFPRKWHAEDFTNFLNKPHIYHCFLGCLKQGEQAGFILISQAAHESEILSLCVLPDHRKKGIAGALLSHTLSYLRESNISQLFLEVAETNDVALSLYYSIGFKKNGIRHGYSREEDGTYSNALMMQYDLLKDGKL